CHRGVADDGQHALFIRAPGHVARNGEPVGGGDTGSRMARAEQIVVALLPAQETAQSAILPQRIETLQASGQHLVGVTLVAGVPDDLIFWNGVDGVESEDEVYRAQVGREVTAGLGQVVYDGLTQFGGNLFEFVSGETLQIGGAVNSRKQLIHSTEAPFWTPLRDSRATVRNARSALLAG